MKFIADLQIHSRYSNATSKNLNLENLEKYAKIKGLNLLGTGDISHPTWLKEIKEELTEDGSGILTSKSGFKFILQGEISNIYSQDGRGRRIHNLIFAPSIEVVEQIQQALLKKGRIDYDGRPIFGFTAPELVEMMKRVSKDIEIVPAHIWTPWFSLFGSKSGFDTVKECFQDQTKHIHALETGISSDPAMNRRLSQLDKYTLISNSDAHSFWPWRLGREANIFDINPTYKDLIRAIQTGKGLTETIEAEPNYGKYHIDGHRACDTHFMPEESKKINGICPKCKKPLTIGVLNRIEELADRPEDYVHKNDIPFKTVMPLSEIISFVVGKALTTKAVSTIYDELIKNFDNEFNILLNITQEQLEKVTTKEIASAIILFREGKATVEPGFDGVYGKITLKN